MTRIEHVKHQGRSVETKIAIVLAILAVGLLAVAFAADIISIPITGTVEAIGVDIYWDAALTNPVTSIDWPSPVKAGQIHVYPNPLFIVNTGNTPITLNLTTPDIPAYLTESWNYTGAVLDPNEVAVVQETLTVDASAPSGADFAYTLVVAGVET